MRLDERREKGAAGRAMEFCAAFESEVDALQRKKNPMQSTQSFHFLSNLMPFPTYFRDVGLPLSLFILVGPGAWSSFHACTLNCF